MATYLPANDSEKVTWLNNFKSKINNYATSLGFTASEITSIQQDADYFQHVVHQLDAYKQLTHSIASYKEALKFSKQQSQSMLPELPVSANPPTAVPAGLFVRIGTYVLRIRRHANYSDAIGQDLGIVPPVITLDTSTLQPHLDIIVEAGHPHLSWKKGKSDSIVIFVDRNTGNGFKPLIQTVKTEYIDTATLPANTFTAQWSYKARYKKGDDEVGAFSPVITVNVFNMQG